MNYFTYAVRYLLVIAETNFQEAYWDQTRVNDIWAAALAEMVKKNKKERA